MRLPVLICGLLLGFSVNAAALKTIDVITVEYPPYTTPDRADDGLVYRELRDWIADRNLPISLRAHFMPPARANHMVETTDWCLSLYPPSDAIPHEFLQINASSVKIGLVRKREETEFDWDGPDYFRDAKIAILRTKQPSPNWQTYRSAGASFVYVDTKEQGLKMVLRDRVDYAAVDLKGLELFRRSNPAGRTLQFSKRIVEEFPIGIFVSDRCRSILGTSAENEKGASPKDAPLQN